MKLDLSWYWRKICALRQSLSKGQILADGHKGKFKASLLYNSTILRQLVLYSGAVWNSVNMPKHRFML
uniref:Uncharacterized protein n=1 Tax=Cannabis sativa TaxID=3483 RepID=A0A803QTZ9_CANSA